MSTSHYPPVINGLMKCDGNFKKAYLWIATIDGYFMGADLFFSSPQKFIDLGGEKDQLLMEVKVPVGFEDWDYIPGNY